jgi:hypothetical protein
MSFAIFGISNGGLNLVVSLLVLGFFVIWLALIVYTYLDAKRRISDPFLVGCATLASFFPYIGTAVYAIVRPPEFLEDAHERELEIKAAELRVRHLIEQSCPNCEHPVEKSYLRCPNCQRRLKDPCPSCNKPVDPRWALCPFCETELPRRAKKPQRREPAARRKASAPPPREETERPATRKEPAPRAASKEASRPKRQQRSTAREPDPDPRQA